MPADSDQLESLTQYALVTESMNALYGEENLNDWAEHMPARDGSDQEAD